MISIVLEKAAVANWLPSVFRGKNAIDRPKNLFFFFEWLTLIAARVQLTRGWRKGGCRYSYVISFSAIPRKGTTAATARTCLERLLVFFLEKTILLQISLSRFFCFCCSSFISCVCNLQCKCDLETLNLSASTLIVGRCKKLPFRSHLSVGRRGREERTTDRPVLTPTATRVWMKGTMGRHWCFLFYCQGCGQMSQTDRQDQALMMFSGFPAACSQSHEQVFRNADFTLSTHT